MSLRPPLTEQIPDETVRIARAAFPKGTLCIRLRDELGPIFQDAMFASLYSQTGQPALSPWRLALVSVLQFVEGLSDRQAADAVRSRIDWKYALALELGDPGFDFSALCEFRARLVADKGEDLLFEAVLRRLIESGLLKPHGRYRTDSTHVLAAIRNLNRLEAAGETLRAALNELATMAPEWLRRIVDEGWAERYGRRVEDYRLPKSEAARRTLAEQIGADGSRILAAVYEPDAPGWLRDLPMVQRLRLYWVQQFHMKDDKVTWRSAADLPPAGVRPHTPYDPDARYGGKRMTSWHGYKVHLTETCDDDAPRLVVHVATTSATVPDLAMTIPIHEALEDRGILPHRHYLDAGYVDAGIRVHLQRAFQVEPISPVRPNCNWQDKAEGGYSLDAFVIDWENQRARCPQGHFSTSWRPNKSMSGGDFIQIAFSHSTCRQCPSRSACTRSPKASRRLSVRPRLEYEAIQQARQMQEMAGWQADYDRRAGIEGTLSQGIRAFGLRKCRYFGLAKTSLQEILAATAMNMIRAYYWFAGRPLAKTRLSSFAAMYKPAV
jgi:transposase